MQLEWSASFPPNDHNCYDHCEAVIPFGVYSIEWQSWKPDGTFMVLRPVPYCEFVGNGYSLEDAKMIAQADFEDLINSCIVEEK